MADPQVRTPYACSLGETLLHIVSAIAVVVAVYLFAGVIGDGAIAATRYFTG